MKPETATLFAALIGVGGALSGLVVERLLRNLGQLWCEPSGWKVDFCARGDRGGGNIEVPPAEAQWVDYSVRLDLFNGKEIPVGLRNVALVFRCSGGEVRSVPKDKATKRRGTRGGALYDRAYVVNLPPRQWVVLELFDSITDPEEVLLLSRRYRAEFVGERQRRGLFEPKTFRKTVASWPREEVPQHPTDPR